MVARGWTNSAMRSKERRSKCNLCGKLIKDNDPLLRHTHSPAMQILLLMSVMMLLQVNLQQLLISATAVTPEGECNGNAAPAAAAAFEPEIAMLVDTDRYPIFTPDSSTYQTVVAMAQREMAVLGSVGLEGFIREDKIQSMVRGLLPCSLPFTAPGRKAGRKARRRTKTEAVIRGD